MRRRDFIAGLGASAWPPVARAQQRIPAVGLLSGVSFDDRTRIRSVPGLDQRSRNPANVAVQRERSENWNG
jgi:hypothetical protein